MASRRTRTEEDAGIKEDDAGCTMLVPKEDDGEGRWRLRRRMEYDTGTEEKKGGGGRWR